MSVELSDNLVRSGLSPQQGATPRVSFEVFPPKSEAAAAELWATLKRLEPLQPGFVSVTYGALGSTRDETRGTLAKILADTRLTPTAHLTCYGGTRQHVDDILRDYWQMGVRNILSLRGDLPQGGDPTLIADGYQNATELTAAIARIAPFDIGVAAFPEKHPESPSLQFDIDVLKAKQDVGATHAITQFFFDIEAFYRYVDLARKSGVTIPIIPGVMPVANFKGLARMAERCEVAMPARMHALFEGLDDQPQTRAMVSAAAAAEFCGELIGQGFDHLHIYTLNKSELTYALCRALGLRDTSIAQAAA